MGLECAIHARYTHVANIAATAKRLMQAGGWQRRTQIHQPGTVFLGMMKPPKVIRMQVANTAPDTDSVAGRRAAPHSLREGKQKNFRVRSGCSRGIEMLSSLRRHTLSSQHSESSTQLNATTGKVIGPPEDGDAHGMEAPGHQPEEEEAPSLRRQSHHPAAQMMMLKKE